MDAKDKRGKVVSEVFNNIKFIKISGLENFFLDKILKSKEIEIYWRNKMVNRSMISQTLNTCGPNIFMLVLFSLHIYIEKSLDVPTIFTAIQIFNLFRWNFAMLPYLMINYADLHVSSSRITLFLLSEEIDDSFITRESSKSSTSEYAIQIREGNFYWEDKEA